MSRTDESTDTNAAVWKSDEAVSQWASRETARERRRREQRRLMAELLPFGEEQVFTFVDLGAGTGAAARAVLDRFARASAILADYSTQMMAAGEESLRPYRGRYRYVSFDLLEGRWPDDIPAEVGAVISSMCVHHLPDRRKRELFGEILARLAPGGWYLNYDPVTAGDAVVEAAWRLANDRLDPSAAAARSHRSPAEQARHENHIRYMIPLAPQLDFLRDAGFEGVDVYWKQLDQVIYGGRRPVG